MPRGREGIDWSNRSRAPRVYRGSRGVSPARLAIPLLLLMASAGVVGAAVAAYLSTSSGRAAPAASPVSTGRRASHSTTASTHPAAPSTTHATRTAPRRASAPPDAAARSAGHGLNDEGYALIQRGQYAAAVAPLRQAVRDLRGAGPADPYEAFANYNLGYALLHSGDCAAAIPPLTRANRLETSPLVDRALAAARACGPIAS